MKFLTAAIATIIVFALINEWIDKRQPKPINLPAAVRDSVVHDTVWMRDTLVIIRRLEPAKLRTPKRRTLQHFFPRGQVLETCTPECDTIWKREI